MTPKPKDVLADLIERLKQATGPDREIDLAIHLALYPEGDLARVVKSHPRDEARSRQEGYSWYLDGEAVIYKKIDGDRCVANGGYPLPEYTKSIDAVVPIIPERHGWFIENTTLMFIAQVYRLIDIDLPAKRFDGEGDYAAIALCIAALTAISKGAEHG
jgi:hypothetical protein